MPTKPKELTYATVCSGIECMSAAVGPLGGWKPVFFSEIEPFPCSLLAHRYPTVPNLGDMTKITAERTGENAWRITNGENTIDLDHRLDVLAGGTPCFVAGTMVLTETGYRPIETLKVGDKVLTHKHRLRPIVRVGSKMANGIVDARFATRGILRCTDYHPFPMAARKGIVDGRIELGDVEKVEVKNAVGLFGFKVDRRRVEDVAVPDFPKVYDATPEQICELAGWYVGDGYIRRRMGESCQRIALCLNSKKLERFREAFGEATVFTVSHEKTEERVIINCKLLAEFLAEHFGEFSESKRIPLWLYAAGDTLVEAFVRGYLATDGDADTSQKKRFTTVSPALAMGVADLLRTAYIVRRSPPGRRAIKGKLYNQRPVLNVVLRRNPSQTHDTEQGLAVKCKSVTYTGKPERVFNIEVEEDHTYVANGIITKNCQDVSVAGKRAGMAEGSGTRSSLAFHFARLCRELQPRWVLWENVPGVLTSNGGRDFAHFVESIGECGYSLAYRTLDAQWVRVDGLPRAVPQRRRRVWLVGHLGDGWRAPAEVLFEPEGVRGDTAPCRVTGQGFAGETGGGAQGADRPLPTNSNGEDVMPTLTAVDLVKRMTGEADRGGGYVISPSGFDPYEPGGVKSATDEVSGTIVNGSSPGFHNAVCFENHQAGNHKHTVAEVAPTMGASRNAQAANNNPLVVAPMSVATKQQSLTVSTEVAATLGANDGKEPQAVVAPTEVFGQVGHAINKAGDNERYEKIEVAETRNTFANGEVRAQEVVVQPKPDGEVVAIDMDKNKPTNADKPVRKGGAGFGVSEKGASYTLTARDQHAVAYAIDSMGSNAMKSKNPHSGCREVECAPTLTTVDSAPVKHQGGTAVVAFLPGNSAKAQGLGAEEEVSPTLVKTQGESGNKVAVAAECVGVFDMAAGKSGARTDTSGVSPTILALHGTDPHAVCIGFDAQMGKMNDKPKENLSETLAVSHQCGVAIGFNAEVGSHADSPKPEVSGTLAARHKCGVAIGLDRAAYNQSDNAKFAPDIREECSPTMISRGPCAVSFEPGIAKREGASHRFSDEVTSTLRSDMGDNLPAVAVDYIVRRLTPLECERLQGLPDGYTKIPHRGKPAEECPDTPRYKALGNGWAVNCARWICQRIQRYDETHEQENTHGNE